VNQLVTLDSTATVDEILEVFNRDGAVIIRNLVDENLVSRLRADLDAVIEQANVGTRSGDPIVDKFWGARTKRFGRLAWRSPAFIDVLTNKTMVEISDRLLLPNAVDWWLNSALMVIGPGEKAQVLHRDVNNWPFFETPAAPEVTVSWMVALGPFTRENGATNVVPGSHAWSDFADRSLEGKVVQAEM